MNLYAPTGYLNSAAKGMSGSDQTAHDTRYDIGEEYMQVMYQLWEGSWEHDAVARDRAAGIFTHPEKVHKVQHDGKYFRIDAVHLCEPSPQRTPLLYQAGASTKGVAFAARHAECVFIAAPTKRVLAPRVADIRRGATAQGRDPSDILIFTLMTVIVGRTDAEAQAKHKEYRRHVSHQGALSLMSGWTGHRFWRLRSRCADPIHPQRGDPVGDRGADLRRPRPRLDRARGGGIRRHRRARPGDRRLAAARADELQSWIEDTDIDGFNLAYAVTPETFADIVDLLVPELQHRGVYKTEYAPGTLREKLFGRGRLLEAPHPAAGYRHWLKHPAVQEAAE